MVGRDDVAANFLTVVLLTFWLSLWIDESRVRILVSFLFQAHWLGPVRNVWYYSTLVDQVGHTVSLAFLPIAFSWQAKWFVRSGVLALVLYGLEGRGPLLRLAAGAALE